MSEMANAGEYHGNIMLVTSFNRLFVSYRASRLDNGSYSMGGQGIHVISKGEERI